MLAKFYGGPYHGQILEIEDWRKPESDFLLEELDSSISLLEILRQVMQEKLIATTSRTIVHRYAFHRKTRIIDTKVSNLAIYVYEGKIQ